MFDPKEPVRANRAISVRDLARAPRVVLDEVEWNGEIVVLTRHGRMAAILAPLPDRTLVEVSADPAKRRAADTEHTTSPAENPEPEWLELTSLQREILIQCLENHPMPFSLNDLARRHGVRDASINVSALEMDGYIDRSIRGNRLTPGGVAAARWLAAQDAGPPS